MKRIKIYMISLNVYIFVFFLFTCGCRGINEGDFQDVINIEQPSKLSTHLQNKVISFIKVTNGETVIYLTNLAYDRPKRYRLDYLVHDVDISPGDKFITYVQGENVDGNIHQALWFYDLIENFGTKVASWEKDITEIVITNPSFSPDGNKVIFTVTWLETNNNGLAIVNIDGSELNILNTNSPLNEGPRISPDGSHIIVTCAGLDAATGYPGFQLCLLDKNGLFRKQLTNRGDLNSSYYFTPDGKKIAYSEAEFGGIFKIIKKRKDRFIVMDIDGKNKVEILNWDIAVKGFSDDSQEIIFVSRPDKNSPRGIYIINIDGSNLRHLTYFDAFLEEWYSDIESYY